MIKTRKSACWSNERPQGLKASKALHPNAALEAPLFHGVTGNRSWAESRQLVGATSSAQHASSLGPLVNARIFGMTPRVSLPEDLISTSHPASPAACRSRGHLRRQRAPLQP